MPHIPTGEELSNWSSYAGPDAVFSTDYYTDEFVPDAERTVLEVNNLRQLFSDTPNGSALLDIGCGEGRITFPLAEQMPGHTIVGIDKNARWDDAEKPSNTRLALADMRELPFSNDSVDGSFIMFTTFGYFSDKENIESLQEAIRVTKPDHRVIIDSPNNTIIRDHFSPHPFSRERSDGTIVEYKRSLASLPTDNPAFPLPLYLIEERFNDKGEPMQPIYLRLYTQDEFVTLAQIAGAKSCGFLDETLEEFDPNHSKRMYVVITK